MTDNGIEWRAGRTYNVETAAGGVAVELRYFGDMHLAWDGTVVHLFYTEELSRLSDNVAYDKGDLIALRDEDIVSVTEGRGRSGGFPY